MRVYLPLGMQHGLSAACGAVVPLLKDTSLSQHFLDFGLVSLLTRSARNKATSHLTAINVLQESMQRLK